MLSQEVIDKVEGYYRIFLWNGDDTGRNNLEKWVVTLYIKEAGIGVKEGLSWNNVTLFKLVVDIAEHRPCIWTRWVESTNEQGVTFWTTLIKIRSSCFGDALYA